MKPEKETPKKPLPAGFTIKPELEAEYTDQPLFKDKVCRANHILKTFGLPKFGESAK